jgi:ABC-2 type transport system ATP-binding protein
MSIRINGLNKNYGTQKVLNEVSFEVKPGEVLGFLGPNGAGKSTTLKIITGLVRPDQGDVTVCGMSVNTNPLACRQKIG